MVDILSSPVGTAVHSPVKYESARSSYKGYARGCSPSREQIISDGSQLGYTQPRSRVARAGSPGRGNLVKFLQILVKSKEILLEF